MSEIEIFRAGTHTDMHGRRLTFSEADIAQCAASYSPNTYDAPLVVGHPKMDAPAYGWVNSLRADGGILKATPRQVDPEFSEAVNAGRFPKVSACFYLPDAPNHPKPGSLYLRHVGFLGGMPPAVKGLKTVSFAEDAAGIVTFGDEFAAFAERERRLTERETAVRKADFTSFLNGLLKEGRLRATDPEPLAAFMEALTTNSGTIEFADPEDGEIKPHSSVEWFKSFLARMPPLVMFGEVAGGPIPGADDGDPDDSNIPPGYVVDPASAALHRRAKAHQKKNGGSYADAVRAVAPGGGK